MLLSLVVRRRHPRTGTDNRSRLDESSPSSASRLPRCRSVADGALVKSLRPASQAEGGQQRVASVGACRVRRHSERNHSDGCGPHDVCEGVEGFGPAFPPLFVAAHGADNTRRAA